MLNTYDRKVWQPHDCVVMTGNSDGEKFGALGFMGGTEGKKHTLGVVRKGEKVPFRLNDVQYVEPEDLFWSKSGGGGGVGDPLDREAEKVLWDVLNDYISLEHAKDVYGVVIDLDAREIDHESTQALREKLRGERRQ